MKINLHAGHNPAGKVACGAVGLLDESKENRLINAEMIKVLKSLGHTVYDCTVNNGTGQTDVLKKICAKDNAHSVDISGSIHLNSGRNDKKGDKKQGGYEINAYNYSGKKKEIAEQCVANMKALGFKTHGNPYKVRTNLYYLKHSKNPCLLHEVCFVDDRDDYELYKKVGYKEVAKALAYGMVNKAYKPGTSTSKPSTSKPSSKPTTSKTRYYPKCKNNEDSLIDGLKYVKTDYSFSHRKKIAQGNGISGYRGSAVQNIKLLDLLKKGKLKKA